MIEEPVVADTGPAARTRAAVSSPVAATTSKAATFAPSRAKTSQATRPMPLPAPVMMQTLSCRRIAPPVDRHQA